MNLTSFSTYKPRGDAGRFVVAKVTEALKQGITAWAERVLGTAQSLVPVDTGELKASGHVVVNETGSTVAAAVVFDAGHSVFVEYGTGQRGAASPGAGPGPYNPSWPGMAAQPYLRPAYDEHRGEALGMTKEAIAVAIK